MDSCVALYNHAAKFLPSLLSQYVRKPRRLFATRFTELHSLFPLPIRLRLR